MVGGAGHARSTCGAPCRCTPCKASACDCSSSRAARAPGSSPSAGVADTLALAGPLGTGFPLEGVQAALLVGGGIGTAPLQFVADVLRARGVPVTAAFGFRDEAQARLAGAFEIDDLWVATDDGTRRPPRHAPSSWPARSGRGRRRAVLACGPAPMLAAVRAWAAAAGLSGYASLEAHMACGTGACHGCVVATREGYLRVCVEGPVFPLDLLAPAVEPRVRRRRGVAVTTAGCRVAASPRPGA